MPARKTPSDWRPRTVALLRAAVELGSLWRAAAAVGERRELLVESAIAYAEAVEVEMIEAGVTGDPYRFNKACGIAADRLESAAAACPKAA